MTSHALKVALLGSALAMSGSGFAAAQQAAPRCGGLFCDMGLIGGAPDRTTLPCDDFFCRAFGGGRTAEAAPPAPAAAAEPEPAKSTKTMRRKRMAKGLPKAKAKSEAMDETRSEPKADTAGK